MSGNNAKGINFMLNGSKASNGNGANTAQPKKIIKTTGKKVAREIV